LRRVSLGLLALFFIVAGSNHFVHPAAYARIVPPWLPAHGLLVAISGCCEILGGLGVLVARTRWLAGIGLIALLVAVFPANVQMAAHPTLYTDIGSATLFYLRLPLQVALVAWVWWTCLTGSSTGNPFADTARASWKNDA
jgi:uncharacterized membrane protein